MKKCRETVSALLGVPNLGKGASHLILFYQDPDECLEFLFNLLLGIPEEIPPQGRGAFFFLV